MILHQGSTLVDDVRLGSDRVDFLLQGTQLLYYRRGTFDEDIGEGLSVRIDDTENKFFELHWLMDEEMTGSVEDGFTHPEDSRLTFVVERSEDLETWTPDFLNVAAPEDQMDGTWLYKARSPMLVGSVTKTGQLTLSRPRPDPRSNPLTSITIADVELTLPNYPYDMPADAATLQADLIAEGFTGATVTDLSAGAYWVTVTDYAAPLPASPVNRILIDNTEQDLPNFPYAIPGDEAQLIADLEDLGWTDVAIVFQGGYEIEIPNVESSTDYNVAHRVEWTPYLVENSFGDLVNSVGQASFSGIYVNEDGIRTNVLKQFGRVRAVWTP
jgi:hypothetical protein